VGLSVRATGVPAALARMPLRTFRPQQAAGVYAFPGPQLARLESRGALHRIAHGSYCVVPQEFVGTNWTPALEAAAAGIAAAHFGAGAAPLMGLSAARLHGAIPRALGVAFIAAPVQRRPMPLTDRPAIVHFVKRNTRRLDAEVLPTELGMALVTTAEQTVLDLARLPAPALTPDDIRSAIRSLLARCDEDTLDQLAAAQRLGSGLARARALAG
jgi:predicted transcriptional regulator of viral defense system